MKAFVRDLKAKVNQLQELKMREEKRKSIRNQIVTAYKQIRAPASHKMEKGALLGKEAQEYYRSYFQADPYVALAQMIAKQEIPTSEDPLKGVMSIHSMVELASLGAKQEWQNKQKKNQPNDLANAKAQWLNFEKLRELFSLLETCIHKGRLDNMEHYQEIVDSSVQAIPKETQETLKNAINQMIKPLLPTETTPGKKQLESRLEEQLNYNRAKYLETRKQEGQHHRLGRTNKEEHKIFLNQIADFVKIGMYGHQKGSQHNPLDIHYMSSNNLAEAALGILMEYKRQAIFQERSFYVRAPNAPNVLIEITPHTTLREEEQALFMHFAMQKPTVNGKEAKHCAAYPILRHEMNIESKKIDNPQYAAACLQKSVAIWQKRQVKQMKERADTTVKEFTRLKSQSRPRV